MLDQNKQNLTPFRFTVDIFDKSYQEIEIKKRKDSYMSFENPWIVFLTKKGFRIFKL